MYWVGVFTAGMTAFYVFRAFFLAFFGEPRWKADAHDAHGHDDHGHGHGGRTNRRRRCGFRWRFSRC